MLNYAMVSHTITKWRSDFGFLFVSIATTCAHHSLLLCTGLPASFFFPLYVIARLIPTKGKKNDSLLLRTFQWLALSYNIKFKPPRMEYRPTPSCSLSTSPFLSTIPLCLLKKIRKWHLDMDIGTKRGIYGSTIETGQILRFSLLL